MAERSIGAVEAQRELANILRTVSDKGDRYVVEDRGKAIAAVVPIALYQRWKRDRDAFVRRDRTGVAAFRFVLRRGGRAGRRGRRELAAGWGRGGMISVLDTNVVVGGFLSAMGAPAEVTRDWRRERFERAVSPPLLAEYRRALAYDRVRKIQRSMELTTARSTRRSAASADSRRSSNRRR